MPDTPVEPTPPRSYPPDMEARVAVLEQIARTNAAALKRIDRRLDQIAAEQRADFHWLLGIMLAGFGGLLGVVAHGFHWL